MRARRLGVVFALLIVTTLLFSVPASAVTTYQPQHVIWINGAPPSTTLTMDIGFATSDSYYIADRLSAGVDVFNAKDDFYLGTFGAGQFTGAGTSSANRGPNGVLVDDKNQIWAGDGNNTVKVGTLATGVTHVIPTGGLNTVRADELGFDPADHLVAVGSDKDPVPFLTFISTTTYTVVGHTVFDGTQGTPVATGLEQPAWNPVTGLMYVTVPTATDGEVDGIDPHTFKVVQRIHMPGCGSTTGLAIGPNGNMAAACATGGRILRATDGAVLATLPMAQTAPTDEIWYNPVENVYLFGITNGGLAIVDAASNTLVQKLTFTLPTGVTRCCAPAANPSNGHIYQPIPGVGIVVTFRQPATAPACVSSFLRRC